LSEMLSSSLPILKKLAEICHRLLRALKVLSSEMDPAEIMLIR
jgi:hypothetical protein